MKKKIIAFGGCFVVLVISSSFCGFYVSKADGALTNKTSQVIIARDGDRSVITMYNDFHGDIKDFAMVVPVPVVLQKSDVRIVENNIFTRLNDYSAARLVEYYDENPCSLREYEMQDNKPASLSDVVVTGLGTMRKKATGVQIEAQYTVGEYDILILSSTESIGLKTWLNSNGYKIPANAEEVLDPYIKSNMKFFVVKVNVEAQKKIKSEFLRPLQIRFSSPKFMLPIRLGMANADGDQDLIVYAFTKTGRVETTNYRSVEMPTGKNIPLFVQPEFARFYGSTFENSWRKEGKNISFIEYAWDLSPSNDVKCDPCSVTPPDNNDLAQAGVWWLKKERNNDYINEYDQDRSKVFFTRLHVRYNRKSFAQDLMFQATPNTARFQTRYILTHPAAGDLSCTAGQKYRVDLKQRRIQEVRMLQQLTGQSSDEWQSEVMAMPEDQKTSGDTYAQVIKEVYNNERSGKNDETVILIAGVIVLLGAGLYKWKTGV